LTAVKRFAAASVAVAIILYIAMESYCYFFLKKITKEKARDRFKYMSTSESTLTGKESKEL
jgi:hypothetical protein